MTTCPCGLRDYLNCCASYHRGESVPSSPEVLMRSRYSAYALANIEYIKNTMLGKALANFNEASAQSWAQSVKWQGLEVINTSKNSPDCGFVEFVARYLEGGKLQLIHEMSEFHRINGQWFYVDGKLLKTFKHSFSAKIGRNSSCPCGSNKKFKNCHGKGLAS